MNDRRFSIWRWPSAWGVALGISVVVLFSAIRSCSFVLPQVRRAISAQAEEIQRLISRHLAALARRDAR